jgi:clan AA aspartic protease (TIGR02281 family)
MRYRGLYMVADYAASPAPSDQRAQVMNRWALTLCAILVAGAPSFAVGQALTQCTVGQMVTDQENKTGVVVSTGNHLCQVKYPNGVVYGWIYWNLRPAAASGKPEAPPLDTPLSAPVATPAANPPGSGVPLPTILRAAPSTHSLVYRADPRGHVAITALVNGAPVRFLVDTGASRVTLTLEDARAAGIGRGELVFSQRSQTANGLAREAPITLREIRIEQLSVDNVAAGVNENLNVSLLGMTFLKRLKSFEMREGALTISW